MGKGEEKEGLLFRSTPLARSLAPFPPSRSLSLFFFQPDLYPSPWALPSSFCLLFREKQAPFCGGSDGRVYSENGEESQRSRLPTKPSILDPTHLCGSS